MLDLTNIDARNGRKKKKRYGLGFSAGSKTCGRGQKGQLSRSGQNHPYVGFEGGQMPLYRTTPKRGFKNRFRKEYVPVNLGALDQFEDGTVVDLGKLVEAGLLRKESELVKILGNGELTKKITVKAHKFSQSAEAKIASLGGTTEVI